MITENNEPVGTLNRDQIIAFRKWEDTTVGSAMKKLNLFRCGNVTGRHL
jgi:hypothetical protein